MRLRISNPTGGITNVHVTLSRRNLRTLLAKLDGAPDDSAATIWTTYDTGIENGRRMLMVTGEEDEVHYAERPPPGPMHPETETAIADPADGCPTCGG